MTPNIRAYYHALGIPFSTHAARNAPVRCFTSPHLHRHGDRTPSCSIDLISGAFLCHACGAHGGAYDAAIATGRTPREAIDLMITHGLTTRRHAHNNPHRRATFRAISAVMPTAHASTELQVGESDIHSWADALDADGRLIRRLILDRAWAPTTIGQLQIGYDGTRITIPIRNHHGQLRGVLRYQPFGHRHPKMLAVPGTRLGLIPHPATEPNQHVLLVEGPPDMIAARSAGLAAIAVPGTQAWQPHWARLLTGRRVTIITDCDPPGRISAHQIAASLQQAGITAQIVDLAPDRQDGYDLTDRILQRRHPGQSRLQTVDALLRPQPCSSTGRTPAMARRDEDDCLANYAERVK